MTGFVLGIALDTQRKKQKWLVIRMHSYLLWSKCGESCRSERAAKVSPARPLVHPRPLILIQWIRCLLYLHFTLVNTWKLEENWKMSLTCSRRLNPSLQQIMAMCRVGFHTRPSFRGLTRCQDPFEIIIPMSYLLPSIFMQEQSREHAGYHVKVKRKDRTQMFDDNYSKRTVGGLGKRRLCLGVAWPHDW